MPLPPLPKHAPPILTREEALEWRAQIERKQAEIVLRLDQAEFHAGLALLALEEASAEDDRGARDRLIEDAMQQLRRLTTADKLRGRPRSEDDAEPVRPAAEA